MTDRESEFPEADIARIWWADMQDWLEYYRSKEEK